MYAKYTYVIIKNACRHSTILIDSLGTPKAQTLGDSSSKYVYLGCLTEYIIHLYTIHAEMKDNQCRCLFRVSENRKSDTVTIRL